MYTVLTCCRYNYIANATVAAFIKLFCDFPQNIKNHHKHGFKLRFAAAL